MGREKQSVVTAKTTLVSFMSSSPKHFKFSHPGIAVLETIQHYLKQKTNKQTNK